MTKKELKDLKSKALLDEIESNISRKLDTSGNYDNTGNYLSSYDASQNNKITGSILNEKQDDE